MEKKLNYKYPQFVDSKNTMAENKQSDTTKWNIPFVKKINTAIETSNLENIINSLKNLKYNKHDTI